MARLNVNPTRMELKRLTTRLKTARRGYKLLKDKSDEMVRQFSVLIRANKTVREEVEKGLVENLKAFTLARSVTPKTVLEEALMMPCKTVGLSCKTKNVMSVLVPDIEIIEGEQQEVYPYGFATLTGEADKSIDAMSELLTKLIRLAEVEKACNMLADEIEKNKRRVNALEYVMIPQLEETIRYIKMKLEENDRGSKSRLMKVKAMIEERTKA